MFEDNMNDHEQLFIQRLTETLPETKRMSEALVAIEHSLDKISLEASHTMRKAEDTLGKVKATSEALRIKSRERESRKELKDCFSKEVLESRRAHDIGRILLKQDLNRKTFVGLLIEFETALSLLRKGSTFEAKLPNISFAIGAIRDRVASTIQNELLHEVEHLAGFHNNLTFMREQFLTDFSHHLKFLKLNKEALLSDVLALYCTQRRASALSFFEDQMKSRKQKEFNERIQKTFESRNRSILKDLKRGSYHLQKLLQLKEPLRSSSHSESKWLSIDQRLMVFDSLNLRNRLLNVNTAVSSHFVNSYTWVTEIIESLVDIGTDIFEENTFLQKLLLRNDHQTLLGEACEIHYKSLDKLKSEAESYVRKFFFDFLGSLMAGLFVELLERSLFKTFVSENFKGKSIKSTIVQLKYVLLQPFLMQLQSLFRVFVPDEAVKTKKNARHTKLESFFTCIIRYAEFTAHVTIISKYPPLVGISQQMEFTQHGNKECQSLLGTPTANSRVLKEEYKTLPERSDSENDERFSNVPSVLWPGSSFTMEESIECTLSTPLTYLWEEVYKFIDNFVENESQDEGEKSILELQAYDKLLGFWEQHAADSGDQVEKTVLHIKTVVVRLATLQAKHAYLKYYLNVLERYDRSELVGSKIGNADLDEAIRKFNSAIPSTFDRWSKYNHTLFSSKRVLREVLESTLAIVQSTRNELLKNHKINETEGISQCVIISQENIDDLYDESIRMLSIG